MADIFELWDSRTATEGADNPSVELRYMVKGTDDDAEVRTLVEATIPAFYAGLQFESYQIEPQGGGVWTVSARYSKLEPIASGSSFSFDTGGGTQHITQSLATVGRFAAPGRTAPDCQGAIGVTNDSVEGVDITVPVYNFSETHRIHNSFVTGGYKATLFALTGRVNGGPYKGFAKGELLFLGASGSMTDDTWWEITYRFAASPNAFNLAIGQITIPMKEGWQYLWVRYEDAEDANTLIKRPVAAYVEQVYPYGDFSLLGI